MPGSVLVAMVAALGSYLVVLQDRSALTALGPPRVQGVLAILELADGTLVSVPSARIDWDRTAQVNAAGAKPPGGSTGDGPRRRAPLVTNDTIQSFARAQSPDLPPRVEAPAGRPQDPFARAPVRPAVERDAEGNPASYWRERAALARDRLLGAQRRLEAARQALAAEERDLVHGREVTGEEAPVGVTLFGQTDEERAVTALRLSQLREKVIDAEAEFQLARQGAADLLAEARRAGAPPGWLRPAVGLP